MPTRSSVKPTEQIAAEICHLYGLELKQVLPSAKGYRNTSIPFETPEGWFNVMVYKREPGIEALIRKSNKIGDYVASGRFPARQTVDGRLIKVNDRLACLYHYMPGATIPWEAYTRRHLRELGKQMAAMHLRLQNFAGKSPEVTDILESQCQTMGNYFAQAGVNNALERKLEIRIPRLTLDACFQTVDQLYGLQPQFPLHLDYVRGNILFDTRANEPTITGVLDFEKAAKGHPLIDIARTLAFLLVDCKYQHPAKIQMEFLGKGYRQQAEHFLRIQGSIRATNELLTNLVNLFLVYDFYKFLKHNPYESLESNQHFRRTKALMLHKGLLQVSTL